MTTVNEPFMVYFGPWERSGHFMFDERGLEVPYREGETLTAWPYNEIDGTLQPGRVLWRDHWIQQGPMREGDAVVHHKDGWTALAIWDSSVDKRPGCSSTYIAKGTFTFEQMVEMAKARFSERWNKMRFQVIDVTSDSSKGEK